jgi:hypothetical protein
MKKKGANVAKGTYKFFDKIAAKIGKAKVKI